MVTKIKLRGKKKMVPDFGLLITGIIRRVGGVEGARSGEELVFVCRSREHNHFCQQIHFLFLFSLLLIYSQYCKLNILNFPHKKPICNLDMRMELKNNNN